ncbi:MAG: flagellar hook-associated protein FlgK [Eubacterium sp.]|nr:flagellar hook-associated protein FlgK [Eubacterium sp.]
MPTFQGLDIARSGMMAYNTAMQTAAHNLANIGTDGYSKQTVNLTAQTRSISTIQVMGSGISIVDIERQRNSYYDTKYQNTNSTYNRYATNSYYLDEVQKYVYAKADDDGGITTTFDAFCSKLSETTTDSGDGTRRAEIVTYAETFTDFIQETANNLQSLQKEANEEIKGCVEKINALADKIASVTKQINTLEAYGNNANDLRDQRIVLVDELSQYCNIETLEKEPADGEAGLAQYYVYVDGTLMVDSYNVNHLEINETKSYKAINDIKGLYEVSWHDQTPFYSSSQSLGGKLQALFEFRDGNNGTTLTGLADGNISKDSNGKYIVTLDPKTSSINDVNLLNIPNENGEITIGGNKYVYSSFEVQVGTDGNYEYKFTIKDDFSSKDAVVLEDSITNKSSITVGDNVEYKGIPYYMAQLNEFVRTYSSEFNSIHKEGYDNYGRQGIDFFNATVATTGSSYEFTEKDANGNVESFSSQPTKNSDGTYTGSYYYMTAMNICVSDKILKDPNFMANNKQTSSGKSENLNLMKLANLKDDSKMFLHGAPDSFLQSLTTDVGVDGMKATTLERSQKNILDAVDVQREAISGADEDEETQDLLTYQNLLFAQYKVLSVMNEVIDRLINQTGV